MTSKSHFPGVNGPHQYPVVTSQLQSPKFCHELGLLSVWIFVCSPGSLVSSHAIEWISYNTVSCVCTMLCHGLAPHPGCIPTAYIYCCPDQDKPLSEDECMNKWTADAFFFFCSLFFGLLASVAFGSQCLMLCKMFIGQFLTWIL